MGKVITFINEKGGIGKSSCCFNTAWEMSKNKKILIIDMDGQRANITFFCGVKKEDGMKTIFDVLSAGVSMSDCIVSVKKNLDLLPANSVVSQLGSNLKVIRMIKAIKEIEADYDYIFIDVNPTPNWSHALALSASNYIIIPMLPDIASLEANNGIAESIEDIKFTANPNIKVLGILFNKNDNRTNLSKEVDAVANKMAKNLDTIVFKTKIRNGVAASENVSVHKGVTEYNKRASVSNDFVDFVKELTKRIKQVEKEG